MAAPLACAPIECMWPSTVSKRSSATCRTSIDLIGEPGKPAREGGREHEDRSRRVDDRAHRRWQLTDVSDGGVGDEQQPLDRRSAVRQVGREICESQDGSRLSPCVSTFGSIEGRRGRGPSVSCDADCCRRRWQRAMASRAAAPSETWASGDGHERPCGAAKLRALAVVASDAWRPPSFSHLSMLSSMERVSCLAAGADIGSSPHSGRDRTPTPRVARLRTRTGSESARDEWL